MLATVGRKNFYNSLSILFLIDYVYFFIRMSKKASASPVPLTAAGSLLASQSQPRACAWLRLSG